MGNSTSKPNTDDKPDEIEANDRALIACARTPLEQGRNRPTTNPGSDLNSTSPNLRNHRVPPASLRIDPSAIVRNGAAQSAIDAATVHLTIAVRAWRLGVHDAFDTAIQVLKNVNVIHLAKALGDWVKQNSGKVSLMACVLVPLMCAGLALPILGAIGFGSAGIAGGSIAAGIHASIGSVAAGSLFATLTSAGMGGFGVPIVIGTVWGVTSVIGWGIAAWKGWFGGGDGNTGNGGGGGIGPDDDNEGDEDGYESALV